MKRVLDALLLLASARLAFDHDHARALAGLALIVILVVAHGSRR